MPTTPISTDPLIQLKKAKSELRLLKKRLKMVEGAKNAGEKYWGARLASKEAELADKSDRLLPQKQMLLKELSYLVNATSRAVRTTMWSLAPESRRGGR